jgi:hypothetical protein
MHHMVVGGNLTFLNEVKFKTALKHKIVKFTHVVCMFRNPYIIAKLLI